MVGAVLGTDLCPNNLCQFYSWCYAFLPHGERYFTMGLAAVCWAIWNCRNRATFKHKRMSSPFEIVFTACVHLNYWAGLLKGAEWEELEHGALSLKDTAKRMMRLCATSHVEGDLE
ncbi:hypothetical protein CFC21_052124 [Triticum aestivum]|uniref:Post-GPI attachment to proteins factor 3 n=2 Tax=Triticum aestivum TaxID=4565 RepID=A0A9R1G7V9_WHEAT|nr:hypothetical protein CFC21_052123 [Triticum aestivum]KAF7042558.1 hypothetical protein CFC21_052124 [Triticum aestivum]